MATDDLGFLLSLPVDSIAVRAVVASLAALLAARVLLGTLTVARVRAAAALLPPVALAAVLLASLPAPALPDLWVVVESADGLTVRVGDTYLDFAPAAAGLLLAVWLTVAVGRSAYRLVGAWRTNRAARRGVAAAGEAPASVVALVHRLAIHMGVSAPPVRVVDHLPGGAMVLGVRRPDLVLDADLLARLDAAELEGVVAHELAHVRRRDNLVVVALRLLGDAFFFVPGSGWSTDRLLRERELAADAAAVEVTGRPGALASGLLKVLEGAATEPAAACAALLPAGTVVERVERLCEARDPVRGWRRGAEVGLVVASLGTALVAAVALPAAVAGEGDREALAVLVSDVGEAQAAVDTAAFRVWDDTTITPPASGEPTAAAAVDDPWSWTPDALAACGAEASTCTESPTVRPLTLRAPDVRVVDDVRVREWRLDPVVASDTRQVAVFWVQRRS